MSLLEHLLSWGLYCPLGLWCRGLDAVGKHATVRVLVGDGTVWIVSRYIAGLPFSVCLVVKCFCVQKEPRYSDFDKPLPSALVDLVLHCFHFTSEYIFSPPGIWPYCWNFGLLWTDVLLLFFLLSICYFFFFLISSPPLPPDLLVTPMSTFHLWHDFLPFPQ